MVLQMRDKSGRRQMRRFLSARPSLADFHRLPLVDEAFGQTAPEPMNGIIDVIDVIAFALAGHQNVPAMVRVVIPLRGVISRPAVRITLQPFCLILLVFEDQMDVAIRKGVADGLGDFSEYML